MSRWVYFPSIPADHDQVILYLAGTSSTLMFIALNAPVGMYAYTNNWTPVVILGQASVPKNAWLQILVTMHITSMTFDVVVKNAAGSTLATNTAIAKNDPATWANDTVNEAIYDTCTTGNYYIDDIDPGSL